MRNSRVLAVDAGFAHMGWVVVDLMPQRDQVIDYGVVTTEKNAARKRALRVADDDVERCRILLTAIKQLVQMHMPQGAVVEIPHGGSQGARANRTMGMATCVVATLPSILGVPTEWVTPREVKLAMTSNPSATKEDMIQAVSRRWPYVAKWERIEKKALIEHAADALGAFAAAQAGQLCRLIRPRS